MQCYKHYITTVPYAAVQQTSVQYTAEQQLTQYWVWIGNNVSSASPCNKQTSAIWLLQGGNSVNINFKLKLYKKYLIFISIRFIILFKYQSHNAILYVKKLFLLCEREKSYFSAKCENVWVFIHSLIVILKGNVLVLSSS